MGNDRETRSVWRKATAVSFDVDSTVIEEEGIDELAEFCGKGREVAALTQQAMQGNMTFQQSLVTRLNIIKPSRTQIEEFLSKHPPMFTPGIRELVAALHSEKKDVYLISGGFHCLIDPVADQLHVPAERVYANRLKFYFTGEYAGFEENEPTARSGGKARVIRELKEKRGYETVVHVGDGATDLETVPPADLFIGFGGNVIRDSVRSKAEWFVTDFEELTEALRPQA